MVFCKKSPAFLVKKTAYFCCFFIKKSYNEINIILLAKRCCLVIHKDFLFKSLSQYYNYSSVGNVCLAFGSPKAVFQLRKIIDN
ncbi:hypothetical protein A3I18_00055 [Candidatus Campbellbacteria bacterium RIFCSPLOWO2_02_FULL_35_11]|uniref:Uncharacterized protein n=2 Tax=Candidatus Campbelliibacteriota TaxID=1752727 RepID=A0A1F5ELG6_9BACT|nr:MAG: hypothetical protein A3E89_00435 [Candidatus Campbellbacteria bacterium RIFCSPHIGHO2_12_FULL_35_10]OGD70890.1 MAG: hypothetical protein A3I18_00055 [Candidatus Campbellbacteria bacterium RIFCSPLOWO2_02_FULL_35_11]